MFCCFPSHRNCPVLEPGVEIAAPGKGFTDAARDEARATGFTAPAGRMPLPRKPVPLAAPGLLTPAARTDPARLLKPPTVAGLPAPIPRALPERPPGPSAEAELPPSDCRTDAGRPLALAVPLAAAPGRRPWPKPLQGPAACSGKRGLASLQASPLYPELQLRISAGARGARAPKYSPGAPGRRTPRSPPRLPVGGPPLCCWQLASWACAPTAAAAAAAA
eukprot:CAMPEP_0115272996 /NCGR_PEP_ID=MMETSP0270-20121206/54915_1 /TAXON_ID=71861 /ORGANISM="Scrippsiella trochoidea, Strain CCMP3099" /LENGTH=219 /DNA_ID=CAMNT_0002689429 /DNA_START=113 /DNA_END=770 /DNA_ORIENTATION=+